MWQRYCLTLFPGIAVAFDKNNNFVNQTLENRKGE